MTKTELERFISVLNWYCKQDPKAVRALFDYRHSINAGLKDTNIIARDEGAGVKSISALGLINSCLEGEFRIGMNVAETDPEPFRLVAQ
jgi:hypothetical protein